MQHQNVVCAVYIVAVHKVLSFRHSEVKLPERVGCIGLTEDPNILLAALTRAVVLFDLTKQTVVRCRHE